MDLFTYAETRRNEALQQVTRDDWMGAALATFNRHRHELPEVFTGEDIRELIVGYAFAPHHPNAWGALTMALVRKGQIEATGTFTKMRSPTSHARRTFEYRLAS